LVTEIPGLPDEWYEKGVKVITIFSERDIPGAKSLSYIPATMALQKARDNDGVEALYLDRKSFVLEATTSNLFAFIKGKLVTPDKGVLKGITRQAILSIAKNMFTIELRQIHLTELLKAQEIFITGTNKGVVPVIQVDDTIINDGSVGENTKKVISALDKHSHNFKLGKI